MAAWMLALHILGFVLWIGGLIAAAILIGYRANQPPGKTGQALARLQKIFLRGMADPGALLTILGGSILIASNASYYLHAGWLHIKLTFVILLIGLHWIIGTRSGAAPRAGRNLRRDSTLLLAAVLILFVLILIVTLPGRFLLS